MGPAADVAEPASPDYLSGVRIALLLGVLLAASGCQKNEGTPRGAEIFRWDAASASRAGGAAPKEVGPRVVKDSKIAVKPDHKGPVTIAVHVETGTIEITARGAPAQRKAPLSIRATVDANDDWTLTGQCAERAETIVACDVSMRYANSFNDLTFPLNLEVSGDGSIYTLFQNGSVKVE
jgi:hypothetical protein